MAEAFWSQDLDETNLRHVARWVADDELVGIVGEDSGIVAYCHRGIAGEIIRRLSGGRLGGDYAVGDEDTTPDSGKMCEVVHDGCVCTRRPGHEGNHAAGNGLYIVEVWDGED